MKVPTWLSNQDSTFWPTLSKISATFGILTPIGAVATFIATGTYTAPAIIVAVYLCGLITVLITLLLRQERRYLREVRYAPAMLPMRRAFSELANASWKLYYEDPSQDAFRLRLRESLRRLAEAFTLITGTQCRACIKVIQAPTSTVAGHDLLVSTLCRDNEDGEPPRHIPDRINDNTDFKQIFTENKACYFSNDLLAQLNHGYRNSHWQERDIENGNLDYLATIVWPIERGAASRLDSSPTPREIVGFLCVDTKSPGAFLQTYDEALGAGFAQALHLALHRFREIHS